MPAGQAYPPLASPPMPAEWRRSTGSWRPGDGRRGLRALSRPGHRPGSPPLAWSPVAGVTLTSLAPRWWPRADPAVRAAFLLSNDLAVLLPREQLTEALGTDPLSGAGMARWGREMLVIYGGGLLALTAGT